MKPRSKGGTSKGNNTISQLTDPDAIKLASENHIWSNMESGTRIIMRVVTEEVIVHSTVTATYKCPCGRLNIIDVDLGDIDSIWQRGCTITW